MSQPDTPQSPWWFLPEEEWQIVKNIAIQLGETNKRAYIQIAMIARLRGLDFVQRVLRKTLEIEANGGMLVHDGSRRRTPGGVFFCVARLRLSPGQRARIFPDDRRQKLKTEKREPASPLDVKRTS